MRWYGGEGEHVTAACQKKRVWMKRRMRNEKRRAWEDPSGEKESDDCGTPNKPNQDKWYSAWAHTHTHNHTLTNIQDNTNSRQMLLSVVTHTHPHPHINKQRKQDNTNSSERKVIKSSHMVA